MSAVPAMKPSTDDLVSVLAAVIDTPRKAERVRDLTGLSWEDVRAALRELRRRDVVRNYGGGHYSAYQRSCAGTCMRQGRELAGGEVVHIDPETLRWFCGGCWNAEQEHVRSIVGDD